MPLHGVMQEVCSPPNTVSLPDPLDQDIPKITRKPNARVPEDCLAMRGAGMEGEAFNGVFGRKGSLRHWLKEECWWRLPFCSQATALGPW